MAVWPIFGTTTLLCALLAWALNLHAATVQLVNFSFGTAAQLPAILPLAALGRAILGDADGGIRLADIAAELRARGAAPPPGFMRVFPGARGRRRESPALRGRGESRRPGPRAAPQVGPLHAARRFSRLLQQATLGWAVVAAPLCVAVYYLSLPPLRRWQRRNKKDDGERGGDYDAADL